CDDAAQRPASEQVRTRRRLPPQGLHVVRCHVFDTAERREVTVNSARLESIEGLIGAEASRKGQIAEGAPADRRRTEERPQSSARLDGYQGIVGHRCLMRRAALPNRATTALGGKFAGFCLRWH